MMIEEDTLTEGWNSGLRTKVEKKFVNPYHQVFHLILKINLQQEADVFLQLPPSFLFLMMFTLRKFSKEDAQSLASNANNINIAQFLTNAFPHPYTLEHAFKFIEFANLDGPSHIFAIDIDGVAVGAIGLHPQTDIMCKNAELGYWLAEPFWGRGIITQAVKEMVDYGFTHLDIFRIYARPFGKNMASQKVLEKCGFSLEARFKNTIFKNGEYHDELIYAIRRF